MADEGLFTIKRGITFPRSLTWRVASGSEISIAGKTVIFVLKSGSNKILELKSTDPPNGHNSKLTVTDAAAGKFTIKIGALDTASFSMNEGDWRITLESAGDVEEIGFGKVRVVDQ